MKDPAPTNTLAGVGLATEQKDNPKCRDHSLFMWMPGSWLYNCDQKQFDAHDFTVGKGKKEAVEGQLWKITYYPQNDLPSKPSELQIQRNFENAVLKALVNEPGIVASRLRSWGCGQFSPGASNDSDEGRARKRRVEQVKQ